MVVGESTRIRGGDAVLQVLETNDVDTIFGIPGVHTLDIYDALIDAGKIQHILARHEQGAGYMADGYARATGKPGVALIVTGPGITNVSTPIGQAFADSSPVLLIATNQERKYLDKLEGNLHEMTDQIGFMRPITKWNTRVMEVADLPAAVTLAFETLAQGRPRPVHVEIPIDLLAEEFAMPQVAPAQTVKAKPEQDQIDRAAALINASKRAMIFTGGGANTEECAPFIASLAEELGAPVVTSLMGKGSIPEDHPFAVGAFGYRWSADNPSIEAMNGSDLAIVIGTGLGVRTTADGAMPLPKRLIHIDIDAAEIGARYPVELGIVADAAETCRLLLEAVHCGAKPANRWSTSEVRGIRDKIMSPADERTARYIPYLEALRAGMDRDAIVVNDMTMMAYEGVRYLPMYEPRTFLFPRGFGTLGSAMPTALGAKVGRPDRQVVSVSGDGGFQFTLEELGAAVHHQIPVAIVIFNDGTHSAVKAAQKRTYPGRYIAVDLVNPDYVKIADAYGIEGIRAESPEALTEALTYSKSNEMPVLIDVPIRLEDY
ncbi:MAG TPA: thiamine pyrophosphate-binding protein [Thermomicrobiales bacterium]|nr:thiamine pyrophosphate-binding protein [Thermomicrobiales bacterium]